MDTIIKYLTQPSTWIGVISILSAAGITINPELTQAITALGVSASGLVLVVWNQHGKPTPAPITVKAATKPIVKKSK